MKYSIIFLSALALASCGKNTKQKLIGTWLGRSVKLQGQEQKIPEGAYIKFDDKNLVFGQGGTNEPAIPYHLKGDTIITNQAMNGQTMEKRMIILSNDGKKLQLEDPEYKATILLEKKK